MIVTAFKNGIFPLVLSGYIFDDDKGINKHLKCYLSLHQISNLVN